MKYLIPNLDIDVVNYKFILMPLTAEEVKAWVKSKDFTVVPDARHAIAKDELLAMTVTSNDRSYSSGPALITLLSF